MTGVWTIRRSGRILFAISLVMAAAPVMPSAAVAVVVISDGFEDADRNNDGTIGTLDTDWNDSGTFNVFTGTPPTATGTDSCAG